MAHLAMQCLLFSLVFAPCIVPSALGAELQLHTAAIWEKYVRLTEQRVEEELASARPGGRFLVIDFHDPKESPAIRDSLKRGDIYVEKLQTRENAREVNVDDGMIHHWVSAAFIPNVKLDQLLAWVKNYGQHEKYFPEIEKSRLISSDGEIFKIFFRLKRKKVITVVYNTEHTAVYYPLSASQVASKSFTTRIAQVENAGTRNERELPIGNDGGYLWRLNSYWRFEERDAGVYVECESLSLSRDIPFGVGWLIRGLVESVPRESLIGTLTSLRDAVRNAKSH